MKTLNFLLVALLIISAVPAQAKRKASKKQQKEQVQLPAKVDSISYAFGIDAGNGIKAAFKDIKERSDLELKPEIFVQAFSNVLLNDSTVFTKEKAADILNKFGAEMQRIARETQKVAAEKNLAEGKAFLAAKASEAGVQKTESGLLYVVEKQGTGEKPTLNDRVKVHYTGKLISGKKFDSSYDRQQPLELSVGGVIAGWQEGLQLMPVGSKYIFYIPSELGYGERGAGKDIPANSALIFEVELLEIIH